MYKKRSASLQRAARQRGGNRSPRAVPDVFQRHTTARLTRAEEGHFNFGATDEQLLLARLRPVIYTLARIGVRKPLDVSRHLNNRLNIRTACGERWTPRLVWFLLQKLFD